MRCFTLVFLPSSLVRPDGSLTEGSLALHRACHSRSLLLYYYIIIIILLLYYIIIITITRLYPALLLLLLLLLLLSLQYFHYCVITFCVCFYLLFVTSCPAI